MEYYTTSGRLGKGLCEINIGQAPKAYNRSFRKQGQLHSATSRVLHSGIYVLKDVRMFSVQFFRRFAQVPKTTVGLEEARLQLRTR